jgi:hypothetical protein
MMKCMIYACEEATLWALKVICISMCRFLLSPSKSPLNGREIMTERQPFHQRLCSRAAIVASMTARLATEMAVILLSGPVSAMRKEAPDLVGLERLCICCRRRRVHVGFRSVCKSRDELSRIMRVSEDTVQITKASLVRPF